MSLLIALKILMRLSCKTQLFASIGWKPTDFGQIISQPLYQLHK